MRPPNHPNQHRKLLSQRLGPTPKNNNTNPTTICKPILPRTKLLVSEFTKYHTKIPQITPLKS